jgi:type IV pilus assembly protein PilQ
MSLRKLSFLFPLVLICFISACSGLPQNESSDELPTDEVASEDVEPESSAEGGAEDDFADFSDEAPAPSEEAAVAESSQEADSTESLLQEATNDAAPVEVVQNEAPAEPVDDFQDFETQAPPVSETEVSAVEPTPAPVPEPKVETEEMAIAPAEIPTELPAEMPVAQPAPELALIKSVQYKANEAGGTLLVESDRPITFQTRLNSQLNQLVVEIQNAKLPQKLKRSLNMKDIAGVIGSVDAYQSDTSSTARFVIQLRSGANQPFVTTEGNSLLVVAEKEQSPRPAVQQSLAQGNVDLQNNQSSIINSNSQTQNSSSTIEGNALDSRTINDFLDSNVTFYGRKISIETSGMPVKDALRFIADEAGVNIIIDPDAASDTQLVNLKMREVPWDQAFVVVLRTNGLGYTRIGNLLRVAKVDTLAEEEKKTAERRKTANDNEPLKFKIFNINYVKATELEAKVDKFKSARGRIFGNDKSNQLIAQDTEEYLKIISDVVNKFDSQPSQVLIEGRIIEAADSFTRSIGVNWGASGADVGLGNGINLRPSIGVSTFTSGGNGTLSLQLGTLDVLGDLTSTLSLSEVEGKIRILSSPRVVTLSNEKALISQGTQVPIVTTPPPIGGVAQPSTTEYKDVNLKLEVTPQVTADASIIMSVEVERSLISPGSVSGAAPAIDTRKATTRVIVKNGQTTIIGGVYQNDTSTTTTGVPWLKDLPIVGGMFRTRENRSARNELMIFITPRIISVAKEFDNALMGEKKVSRVEGVSSEN